MKRSPIVPLQRSVVICVDATQGHLICHLHVLEVVTGSTVSDMICFPLQIRTIDAGQLNQAQTKKSVLPSIGKGELNP